MSSAFKSTDERYRIQFQHSNEDIQFGIFDEVTMKNISVCTISISEMPNDFQALYAQYNLVRK